jgi:DNA-binding response OmpR family regulator
MPDKIRILYVDDEPSLLELGKFFLERSGQFSVDTINSALAALTVQNTKRYDAIISDYQMPEMNGIDFLRKIRSSGNTIPFILFTGRRREEVVIQALNEGADFYLQKGGEPASLFAELSHKIRYAVMRRHAEDLLKQNEAQLRQIIDLVPYTIFAKDGLLKHSP